MHSDELDDLFRSQLGGHETPPGDDLWARLQAREAAPQPGASSAEAAAEQVDRLYQTRLNAHATRPRRELWERLEDEHLRPRKRRGVAWWPMALAAAIALLLLAGGAGLWLGYPGSTRSPETLATQPRPTAPLNTTKPAPMAGSVAGALPTAPSAHASVAALEPAATSAPHKQWQKNFSRQATRAAQRPSSASKARTMAVQLPAHSRLSEPRQPDAAANPMLAHTTHTLHPANPTLNPPLSSHPVPADEPNPLVASTIPAVNPATGSVLPAPALATANSIIAVDVRSGAAPQRPSLGTAVAVASAEAGQRLGLGGRLLRQVDHLVRGERLSLAEVTGLPQNLTVEAGIGKRRVSTSIQL